MAIYSDGKTKQYSVALIGAYPPPYGGVSVHVQRLHDSLTVKEIPNTVYDIFPDSEEKNREDVINIKLKWYKLFSIKEDIIHLHVSGITYQNILAALFFITSSYVTKKHIILTFHSFRNNIDNWYLRKIILKTLLNKCSRHIAVSKEVSDKLIAIGISDDKISVIPAFIKPLNNVDDFNKTPDSIWNFILNHKPIISANASNIIFYKNVDLYGLDICIDACEKLKKIYPNIGFILLVSNISNVKYYNFIISKIYEKNLDKNLLIISWNCPFYPILLKSDIFIRPTYSEGDAISVREALSFNVPTIASDCTNRPDGTILFRNRDVDDLVLKVSSTINNYDMNKILINELKIENNDLDIMKLYLNIIND